MKSLGADHVIDYTREDSLSGDTRYDFILDAVGKKKSSKLKVLVYGASGAIGTTCRTALTPNGKYMSVDDGTPKPHLEDLVLLRELIEAGHFKAVIDRCFPLEEMVEAHRYVDLGHKKGNVIIQVMANGKA